MSYEDLRTSVCLVAIFEQPRKFQFEGRPRLPGHSDDGEQYGNIEAYFILRHPKSNLDKPHPGKNLC